MFSRTLVQDVPQWAREAEEKMVRVPPGPLTQAVARELGFEIELEAGVSIEAEYAYIGAEVRIHPGCKIRADRLYLGDMVTIGAESSLVSGDIMLLEGAFVGERVFVDLAGGRNTDSRLLMGPASLVGSWVHINTCRSVIIHKEAAVSPGAMIFTHSFWQSILDGYGAAFQPVNVESDACVGAGCQVLPGVTIGKGSVVMANSTVLSTVAPETLVGGVPAVVLRRDIRRPFNDEKRYRALVRILGLLLDRLRERGCTVEMKSKTEYKITLRDGDCSVIHLVTNQGQPPGAGDIVVSTNAWTTGAGEGTVFDVAHGRAMGPENRVAFEVRNHLRRFGIRFEPYAWRADYRRGI